MKIILLFAFCFFSFNGALASFDDTQYSWYRDAVETLQSEGLVSGVGANLYGPDMSITRAEILTILLRASETTLPSKQDESCFPDVSASKWYHTYVCGAHTLGIANGFKSGKFEPNSTVTTLEALAFGVKTFDIQVDISEDEKWYEPLQKFADENNILPSHSYTLASKISRGKSAELIIKLREYAKTKSKLSHKSPGCSVSGNLGETNTIMIGEREREYILSVPNGYNNSREYNLIVAFHGRTNSNAMVQDYMGLEGGRRSSNDTDTIVAYPAGISNGKSFSWSEKENLTFFDAMVAEISENYCINRDRVFLVGHSLGGWMTHRVACLRGEYLKGMATVGTGGYNGDCTGPVSSLLYQNIDDQLSSYENGKTAEKIRLTTNQCDDQIYEDITIGSLTCKKYTECSMDNEVVWCEGYTGYGGDPHSWPTPNGGKDILDYLKNLP